MSTYRQLKPKSQITTTTIDNVEPTITSEQMAAYLRQSSTGQVENNVESADLQLSAAERYAISQGLDADKIVVAHEGKGVRGVSGTLRIDEREELNSVVVGIKEGTIRRVWSYSISRLFRDPYGVQVGTFMEICAAHNVKVFIDGAKLFDFNNSFDVMFFQMLATMAAKENADRAKLLREAKHQKALRGDYDGRPLLPGFVVDRTKLTEKGKLISGKFLVYEPHARIVRWLYARFRELGGQFNILAAEVARMPYVFPDFENWVSPLDISKFFLKKVPGGYHISRVSLMRLLTAVEYIGTWKLSGKNPDGTLYTELIPNNHDAIVDTADWEYAFECVSFTDLNGLPNTERAMGHSWSPVAKQESKETLRGMLTSPLGLVNCSDGLYRIAMQREGNRPKSYGLVVESALIESIFQKRLSERLVEMDGNQFFYARLEKLRKEQTKKVASVPEQIARYQQEREAIQNYVKAVGTTADVATLQKYNADLLEISGHIAALESKQKVAKATQNAVTKMRSLVARIKADEENRSTLLGTDGATEESRAFLRLLIDKIILNEHSAHFLTLTIMWAAPFQQVDVCYLYRVYGRRQLWTTEEEADLIRLFPTTDRLELLQRFTDRTWKSIHTWGYKLGMKRGHGSPNSAEFLGDTLSLNEWDFLQKHGWEIPETKTAHYWLYDVHFSNDVIEHSSK